MRKDLVFENKIPESTVISISRVMDRQPLDTIAQPGTRGFIRIMDLDITKVTPTTDKLIISDPPCSITTPFRVHALRNFNRATLELSKDSIKITLHAGKRVVKKAPTREVVCTLCLEDKQLKQLLRLHARYLQLYDETIKAYHRKSQEEPQPYTFNGIKKFLPHSKDRISRRWSQLPARNISADLTAHYEHGAPNPYTVITNRSTPLPLSSSIVKTKYGDLRIAEVDGYIDVSSNNDPLPDSFESVVMKFAGSNFHLIFQVEDT